MTACNKAGIPTKVITHLNVEYQTTIYILTSWRDIALWFIPGLKYRVNILHLLAHGVPPQCIAILKVKLNCLLHIILDLYPKLVSLQPILGFQFHNDAILLS